MSSAKMTLLGFNRWMTESSDDLFKAFDNLPAGVDKGVLVNNILLRGGEFEVIYSDPYFMQESIYTWLGKWKWTLEKWVAALAIEYDPLNNYDRHEEYTDTEGIGDTETRSGTRTDSRKKDASGHTDANASNASFAATSTDGTDTGSQGTENKVSAFDASTYQAKDRSDTTTGSTTSTNTVTNGSGTASNTENRSDNESESGQESTADTRAASRNRLLQHKAHLFGNIGVTTSQEMLLAELSVAEWNLYDHITDLFLTEYIIPVYA